MGLDGTPRDFVILGAAARGSPSHVDTFGFTTTILGVALYRLVGSLVRSTYICYRTYIYL
jgi:hypothetical protein